MGEWNIDPRFIVHVVSWSYMIRRTPYSEKRTDLTSQETHYVSATESSQLMLCKISWFHGSDYEECRRLACEAVWILLEPALRRNLSPPS
jgi:hypothetical protein